MPRRPSESQSRAWHHEAVAGMASWVCVSACTSSVPRDPPVTHVSVPLCICSMGFRTSRSWNPWEYHGLRANPT